jgi:hypothetical protein
VEENPDISALTSQLVETLAAEVTQSGAILALMAVPSRYRLEHPNTRFAGPEFSDKWREWATERGIDFVDLTQPFAGAKRSGHQPFLNVDGHFNPTGHAVAAEAVRAAYPDVFGASAIRIEERP